jgi:Zn-dependent metalloprotease
MQLAVLFFAAIATYGQSLPDPGTTPVALYGESLRIAHGKLVGRGIVLEHDKRVAVNEQRAVVTSSCGATAAEIVWREVRRKTDAEGGTHVFYRQHLAGEGLDAELFGSEVGVHRMRNGKLASISGRQFESVIVSGCPAFGSAEAVEQAQERVLVHKGEYQQHQPWAMNARRVAHLAETELKLVQIDGTFRSAYFTIGDDAKGEPYSVVLDAEDRRLLAISQSNPSSNCTPTTPESYVTAYSIPVRPELTSWRSMKANVGSRPGFAGFTHEGVWLPSGGPKMLVYFGTNDYQYMCNGNGYTLYPLKIRPSLDCCSPVYDDYDLYPAGHFSAAGDALWNTYKTMSMFKVLGRNGWDNNGGDAKIVVNAGSSDSATFIQTANGSGPANSVVIGTPINMYNLAASLDLVAHEWGHGVIFKTANFPTSTTQGLQFHEGFADVIAMVVEKRAQASGNGLEQSSDFKMHEDAATSGYARGAIDDLTGHSWTGPYGNYTFDDRLHRQDPYYTASHIHATGNMLNVVYLIMSAGGSTDLPSGLNPICARPNAVNLYAGCDSGNAVTFNERLGSSKGGALLFYAIEHTLPSNATWNDVADHVNEAAFLKYNLCQYGPQYNAAAEQNAVKKSFAGIGYPRTHPDIQCP